MIVLYYAQIARYLDLAWLVTDTDTVPVRELNSVNSVVRIITVILTALALLVLAFTGGAAS